MFLVFVFKICKYIRVHTRVTTSIKFVRLFLSQSLVTRSFFLPLPNSFCIRISDLLSSLFHDRSPVPYHKNENFRIATRTANGDRSFKALTKNRFPKTRGMHWHARRCYNAIISHERNVSGKKDKKQTSESLTTRIFRWVHFVHDHALSRVLSRLISRTHLRHSTWISLKCIFRTNVVCGNCKIRFQVFIWRFSY